MATTTITKVSGVLFVTDSNNTNPKSYFGATGNYQFSDDNATVLITIGTPNTATYYEVRVAWGSLIVGTQVPASVSTAKILLNAVFGT